VNVQEHHAERYRGAELCQRRGCGRVFLLRGFQEKGKYAIASALTTCSSNRVVCNNIFYIRDGVVVEYAPTGSCYTDDSVRPQVHYLMLQKK
jgi:hypothetical protein